MTPEQLETLRLTIEQAAEPGTVAILTMVAALISMATAIVLAGCAVVALVYARKQVEHARDQVDAFVRANEDAAKTERARFLFNLDEMYENFHFAGSRADFSHECESIRQQIADQYKHKSVDDRRQLECEAFSERLFLLRSNTPRKYARIMKLCGFFETLEMLIKNGYIEEKHVVDLYGPAILRVSDACSAHIAKRREEDPATFGRYMENFTALALRLNKHRAQKRS